jgi:thiamine biosynthesis protein ThiS
MSEIKNFFLNGERYYTTANITLLDVIHYFNYNSYLLVLEYNHSICSKKNWEKIYITDNDKIEIVTIVGGG